MFRGYHPRLHLLRCADSSRWALLSLPDHSRSGLGLGLGLGFGFGFRLGLAMPDHGSPVNGALLVLKPNASLYEEGLGA